MIKSLSGGEEKALAHSKILTDKYRRNGGVENNEWVPTLVRESLMRSLCTISKNHSISYLLITKRSDFTVERHDRYHFNQVIHVQIPSTEQTDITYLWSGCTGEDQTLALTPFASV